MRGLYVVTYDISDPQRLRRVYETMRGYGDHVQLSVFLCELTARHLVLLRSALREIIHHEEDQVLFIYLGPADGARAAAIEALGRPFSAPRRGPVIT
ncbi:MAG: CRISPR-associated endoribonuclease Cas2 1 [Planctomycetota bacterium]|nr:MAG: CRISPR-associated endoribonuclease Cas2 1 [Planctomycetota bacterium]